MGLNWVWLIHAVSTTPVNILYKTCSTYIYLRITSSFLNVDKFGNFDYPCLQPRTCVVIVVDNHQSPGGFLITKLFSHARGEGGGEMIVLFNNAEGNLKA